MVSYFSGFVGVLLVVAAVVELLKFLSLLVVQKLLVGPVLVFELKLTPVGSFSFVCGTRFVFHHLLNGFFQPSFSFGLFVAINFLKLSVSDSGARITESTHAPKRLVMCDSVRESAQNQHGNSE